MFDRDVQFLAALRPLEPPERMAVGDAEQGEDAEDAGAQPREPGDIGDDQERADELRRDHGCRTQAWRRQVRALHLRDDRSEVEQAVYRHLALVLANVERHAQKRLSISIELANSRFSSMG